MLQKAELQREIEAALSAPRSADVLLNAKREHGLQFLIDARRDQSLANVAAIFHDWSARFEVEPLFPSPPFAAPAPGQEPAWGDTLFVATLPHVAFDDVTPLPWDMAHALRTEGGFARVIPETPIVRPEPLPEPESTSAAPLGWEHKAMRIAEAWAEIERRGRAPGINVRIGHPDTGWMPHEVWENGNLRTDLGTSFMPNEPNSRGQEPAQGQQQPGHGTSTASVIIPPRGGRLEGVAPHAQAIPIRCVSSVVLYPGQPNVMRAVRYAMEQGCHVISMSLGGSAFPFLGPQVVHAAQADILVITASGNDTYFTAEPANYWEVVGVGGTKYDDLEWERSNWFPAGTVTISAPAAEVRKASYKEYRGYDHSNGTSYATAFMAGVAALWLSCHYPNGYRGTRYAYQTFMEHVRRTARKVPGIGPGLFGIVNAGALMTTEPQRTAQSEIPDNASDLTPSGEVARLLCTADLPGVKTLLAQTLQGDSAAPTDDLLKTLEPWIDETVLILRDHLPLRKELSEQAADSAIPAAALRETLIPYASTPLRQQLAGAAGAP